MKRQRLTPLAAALAGLLAAAPAAHATDGYFAHGYGMKSLGMGGAGVATALEPFGGAVNPGAMSFLGNEWQVGASWFSPDRSASRTGSGPAGIDASVTSDSKHFGIPEFGVNWRYSPTVALGVSVFGNGGMNTNYAGGQIPAASACASFNPTPGPYNLLCGNGRLGVDLSQLMIAPYASWQFTPGHSIGVAPVIAYQRFKAEGLQAFDNPLLSTKAGSVTNRGYDDSTGVGVRVGYQGRFGDMVSVGATYGSKIDMSKFDKYAGLFAEGGSFDIPSSLTVGVALRPNDRWLIALDYEKIYYSDVPAVHNPSSRVLNCFGGDASACLGGGSGAGFGWQDIDVWKLGVQYKINDAWTVRFGYNHTDNPIRAEDVTFNILAPGVMEDHFTAGATWTLDKVSEVTGMFMYATRNDVQGSSLFVPLGAPPTTSETIGMKQFLLGVAYSRKF
jgi:long-chain fatty acid transport protein